VNGRITQHLRDRGEFVHSATELGGTSDLRSEAPEFFLSREKIAQRFLELDRTASLFSVLGFMDEVETWAVERFEDASDEERIRLRGQLERLSSIIGHFQSRIEPDNHAFVQVLAQMRASAAFYVIDFLQHRVLDFMVQLMTYCQRAQGDDVHADLMLRRIQVLNRTRLLDRVFSAENKEFVMRCLLEAQ